MRAPDHSLSEQRLSREGALHFRRALVRGISNLHFKRNIQPLRSPDESRPEGNDAAAAECSTRFLSKDCHGKVHCTSAALWCEAFPTCTLSGTFSRCGVVPFRPAFVRASRHSRPCRTISNFINPP